MRWINHKDLTPPISFEIPSFVSLPKKRNWGLKFRLEQGWRLSMKSPCARTGARMPNPSLLLFPRSLRGTKRSFNHLSERRIDENQWSFACNGSKSRCRRDWPRWLFEIPSSVRKSNNGNVRQQISPDPISCLSSTFPRVPAHEYCITGRKIAGGSFILFFFYFREWDDYNDRVEFV